LIDQSRFEVFVALNTLHPYCGYVPLFTASTENSILFLFNIWCLTLNNKDEMLLAVLAVNNGMQPVLNYRALKLQPIARSRSTALWALVTIHYDP